MAGTTIKTHQLMGGPESTLRQLVIQMNKVITDLEKLRVGSAELVGSATFNAANLADGAGETTTVTVTGAALGDFVTAVSHSLDLQGITVTAYVSAADTVSVRLQNESGGAVDLASGTLRVRVSSAGTFTGAASDMTAAKIGDEGGTAISA